MRKEIGYIGTYVVNVDYSNGEGCGWYVSYYNNAHVEHKYLHNDGKWYLNTGGSNGNGYYETEEEAINAYELTLKPKKDDDAYNRAMKVLG